MSYLNRSIADSGSRQPRLARVDNHAAAIDLMDADVDYVDYVSPSSSSPPHPSSSPHPSPSSPSPRPSAPSSSLYPASMNVAAPAPTQWRDGSARLIDSIYEPAHSQPQPQQQSPAASSYAKPSGSGSSGSGGGSAQPSAIRRHHHSQHSQHSHHNQHNQHNHHNQHSNHSPASLSPAAGRSDRLGRTLDQTVLDSKARQVEFIQDDVKALAAHANAVQLDHAIFRRRAGLVWKAGGFLLALLLALAVAELALVVRISSTLNTLNTLAAMNQSAGAHLTTTPSASASASVSVSAAPSISSSGSVTSSTPSSTSTAATASTSSQPTNTALTMVPGVTVDGTVTATASS